MNSGKKIRFEEGTLDRMNVETSIFSPENPDLGVTVLSEKKDDMFIIHILELAQDEEAFFPVQDLAAFSFGTKRDMKNFIERLPNLSGLEMLFLLNPRTPAAKGQ